MALLEAWLAQSHDLLALTDGLGQMAWANPAFIAAAGAATSLQTLLPRDADTAARNWMAAALRGEPCADAELQLESVAGRPLHVRARVSRHADQWLWTLREIGAAHEPAQDATAAQLSLAVDLGDIVVWSQDLATKRLRYNDRGRAFLGLPPDPNGISVAESLDFVHPDDRDRMGAAARSALSNDGPVDIESRFRRADGAWRYMLMRSVVERSAAGSVQAVIGVALDVTDRHAAQAALHAANERAALIARHAGIGTWETDEGGDPALWDEQMFRLRGLTPRANSLNREERLALLHPDDHAHVLDSRPELNGSTQATAYEFRVRWPDGQYRWIASRSAPLFDASGKMKRRVGVNWDITDHKSAELARQQALLAERESEAKSQFLARMSHELRTPLNAVLGFTQLLQLDARQGRNSGPDSDQLDRLSHIRAAGEHLLTLINDALDLSSLEAGTLKLDPRPVSLALAVARALPLIEESAAARRITLRTGRLDGVAQADSTRLHQVLLNLLSNAVKYNRVGGDVVVESNLGPEHVVLRVRDTGRGMNAAQLAHLFEPFNRLGLEAEGIEGSGIGMTIARALVEGMGGRINVSSEAGRGTEFEIVLPRADSAGGVRDPDATADPLPEPVHGLRPAQVLYIEDNAVNVLLVEQLMAQLPGLRITAETTGSTGVARARSLRPDLILVDMQLPDFDGFEVLRRLRLHAETAAIPCIALSANAMPEDIARALNSGFDDYWTKPIRFKEFLSAMARRFSSPAA